MLELTPELAASGRPFFSMAGVPGIVKFPVSAQPAVAQGPPAGWKT